MRAGIVLPAVASVFALRCLTAQSDSLPVEARMKARYYRETPASVRTARLARLAEAEARWAARRPARYRLTARIECFCSGSPQEGTTLEFVNDSLVGIVDRAGRRHATTDPTWKEYSVPALFTSVEKAIRDVETFVEKLDFDPVYGIPTRLETNTVYSFTDGWLRQHINGFRPVP